MEFYHGVILIQAIVIISNANLLASPTVQKET
jgi:hypothetical protein